MSQNNLHTKAASTHILLLTLLYSGTTVRYCRSTEDVTLDADTWTSAPSLEVSLGLQHGGTDDKPHSMTISNLIAPFNRLVSGYKHPQVEVIVEEVDPLDPTTRGPVARGWIGSVTRSPGGKGRLCRCEILTVKSSIQDVQVSIPVLSTCDLPFAGEICGANTSAFEFSGTVASVATPDRNRVTLTLPSVSDPVVELPNAKFRRGRVTVDGLSIMIVESLADKSFRLAALPPPWWVGRPVSIFPGCGKLLSDCAGWNRVSQYRALGVKIPDRNVIFQASS